MTGCYNKIVDVISRTANYTKDTLGPAILKRGPKNIGKWRYTLLISHREYIINRSSTCKLIKPIRQLALRFLYFDWASGRLVNANFICNRPQTSQITIPIPIPCITPHSYTVVATHKVHSSTVNIKSRMGSD